MTLNELLKLHRKGKMIIKDDEYMISSTIIKKLIDLEVNLPAIGNAMQ